MADYKYPSTTLDDRHQLLRRIGNFWSRTYEGNNLVESILFAHGQEELQTKQDFTELVQALSRQTVPIYHNDYWFLLQIKQSEVTARPLRYGDGAVYGNQPGTGVLYKYGGQANLTQYRFTLPDDIRQVPVITNRVTSPSLTLLNGVDYYVDGHELVFTQDLFANPNMVPEPVYEGSDVADQIINLWLVRSQCDWQYIYNHFGYLIAGPKNASEHYRDFVNAVIDALSGGTAQSNLEDVFSAITGHATAIGDETVELVTEDNNHLVIVTDKKAYTFPAGSTAVVAVGDELTDGQQLTDAVTFYDFTRGELADDLLSLHLDTPFLVYGFAGGLTFPNADVSLVVEENVGGKTRVSFELGGYPTDVESFFDQFHSRAVAFGQPTLAELLDVRGSGQTTQPTAASLPATINPCQFLVENVLRFHFAAVRLRVTDAPTTDLSLLDARVLRRLIPPWEALLILLDLDAGGDTVDNSLVSESGPLVSAAEPSGDTISTSSVIETGQIFYLESLCD